MRFKNLKHFASNPRNLSKALDVSPGKKSVYKARKQELINDFNVAVEKGASEQFLKSLYRSTKIELGECNMYLGLLPQDGLARLNYDPISNEEYEELMEGARKMEPITNEQIAESFKIIEQASTIVSVVPGEVDMSEVKIKKVKYREEEK